MDYPLTVCSIRIAFIYHLQEPGGSSSAPTGIPKIVSTSFFLENQVSSRINIGFLGLQIGGCHNLRERHANRNWADMLYNHVPQADVSSERRGRPRSKCM